MGPRLSRRSTLVALYQRSRTSRGKARITVIVALTVRRGSAPMRSEGPRRRNDRAAVAEVGPIRGRERIAMSTIANRPRLGTVPRKPGPAITDFGDQRIVIRGVDRDLYNRLDEAIGE